MARAVAKKRRKKAAKTAASQRPKAPRTEAQIAAARENIARATAAREAAREASRESAREPLPHPADANRPTAFFTLGEKADKAEKSDKAEKTEQTRQPPPKALTLAEVDSFRKKLIEMLISLWELADKGLTVTALDGEEAFIWRTIDDNDTAFIADRVLAKGRENPYVGAQVRMVIDHWDDARMVAIVAPRVLESAGWHQAHGLHIAAFGLDVQVPPKPRRQRRGAQSNGHQAGQPGATSPYYAEGAAYGAQ